MAGSPLAKDVWMFGIGTALIIDALTEPGHDKIVELEATVSEKRAAKSRRAGRKAAKAAGKASAKTAAKTAAKAASEVKDQDSAYLAQVRKSANDLQAQGREAGGEGGREGAEAGGQGVLARRRSGSPR